MRILMVVGRIAVQMEEVTVSPLREAEVTLTKDKPSKFDLFANEGALKMLPLKPEAVSEAFRLLRPGGVYALEITEVETTADVEEEQ